MATEEEYHIPDDDIPIAQETSAPRVSSPRGPSGFKFGRIIPLLVIVAMIWGGYWVYSAIKKARRANLPSITAVSSNPMPIKPQAFTQKISLPTKQQGGGFAPASLSGLDNRLANIEEGNAEAQTKIERANANLAELQNTLTTMTSQDLSSQVTQQAHQLQVLSVTTKEKKSVQNNLVPSNHVITPVVAKKRHYYIQALIPGRAWLYAGEYTTTVRIGDSLPGYGTVTGIDTDQSIVTTSSGDIIAFQSDESET